MSSVRPAIVAITSDKIASTIFSQLGQIAASFPSTLPTSCPDLNALWQQVSQAFLEAFGKYQTDLLVNAEELLGRLGVVPEQLIYIYYYSFDPVSNVKVATSGFTFPSTLVKSHSLVFASPQKNILPDIYEIQAYVPSVDQLQTTRNYTSKRNGVLLWLPLQVTTVVTDTGKFLETLPSGFPVWLPQPIIGLHTLDQGTVKIGIFVSGHNGDDKTNYFGGLAGGNTDDPNGQVRWYPLELWQTTQIGDLTKFDFLPVDKKMDLVNNGLVCLPDPIAQAAAAVRSDGKRISVGPQHWDDNGAEFSIPDEPGFIIIWRDDIPSIPVGFGLENLAEDVIQALADKIWYWSSFSDKSPSVSYPSLGAGEPILLGISQGIAAANNYLGTLLDSQGLSIDFAFLIGKPAGSQFDLLNDITSVPFLGAVDADLTSTSSQALSIIQTVLGNDNLYQVDKTDLLGNPLTNNSQTKPTQASVRPDVDSAGGTRLPDRRFQVQLAAKLTITKDVPQPLSFHVRLKPVVTFSPLPIEIPTVAIFFTDINFAGVPMIVLPENTFNLSGKWDANNPSWEKREKVCSALDKIKTALDIICFFTNDNSLKLLRKGIGCVEACAQFIIDATGDISDLRASRTSLGAWIFGMEIGGSSYDNHISSMIMLGPPTKYSDVTLSCYQDDRNYDHKSQTRHSGGNFVRFGIRDNTFINAVPDFTNLSKKYTLSGTNIPTPKRLDANTTITNFNDCISAIVFE